jgi:hypothetical protein
MSVAVSASPSVRSTLWLKNVSKVAIESALIAALCISEHLRPHLDSSSALAAALTELSTELRPVFSRNTELVVSTGREFAVLKAAGFCTGLLSRYCSCSPFDSLCCRFYWVSPNDATQDEFDAVALHTSGLLSHRSSWSFSNK